VSRFLNKKKVKPVRLNKHEELLDYRPPSSHAIKYKDLMAQTIQDMISAWIALWNTSSLLKLLRKKFPSLNWMYVRGLKPDLAQYDFVWNLGVDHPMHEYIVASWKPNLKRAPGHNPWLSSTIAPSVRKRIIENGWRE